MEKIPQFIREFSKEESSEARQKVAAAIKAKRAKYFSEKQGRTERQIELQQSTRERERALAEQLAAVRTLEEEIVQLSTSRLQELVSYFQLKKLRADAAVGQKTYDELKKQHDTEVAELQSMSQTVTPEELPAALREARIMVSDFYEDQKKKWATSEYTKEDITIQFTEEHLASLSLEEYILLLKRFPNEMVAHVTRQGIRDHTGHIYHSVGLDAYSDGFMHMIEDGRLRAPLGVYLVEEEKEKAIEKFLQLDTCETKAQALDKLENFLGEDQGYAGSYADRMAVHFAAEEVADCYYGSEKGNEIFIAYPSAHIASQYYFSGQLQESGGGYHNDQWVWANEEKGLDLNAGLVFIPEEALVDRKTGSRYELDEQNRPIKNAAYHDVLKKVVDAADFHDFVQQVHTAYHTSSEQNKSSKPLEEKEKLFELLEPIRNKLARNFGISDPRLQMAILDYRALEALDVQKNMQEKEQSTRFESIDTAIEGALRDHGLLYVEAKDTVRSKEFWEERFAKDPTKRPSKIIYYKGANPTEALMEWRKAQGIQKKAKDSTIGFPERQVDRGAPQATAGIDRFETLAKKVIEDHFDQRARIA